MRSVAKHALALLGVAMLSACFTKPNFTGSDAAAPDAFVPPVSTLGP